MNLQPASISVPGPFDWFGAKLLEQPVPSQTPFPIPSDPLSQYLIDAFQRSILFFDILRQRGDEQADIVSRPMATVLRYEQQMLMSGRSLPRPINYSLSRIISPDGAAADPAKRPVVVVDPRAGQGPGIGGFKKQSEIGDALAAGHPVYFIGFSSEPAPGQTFLDVVEGQVKFFERIVQLHPEAPRPMAIGNCQAGYQTLMVAMLRPDLFGPCLVTGSPMSYWQGVHGKNPMRYSGGLLGGSWLTALISDLNGGRFDGTWLIANFDNLNPANWLWGKQYNVYAHADTEGPRYLEFERWWGDFIILNGGEIQYLVDELFIGDKLTRNELQASDGRLFDLRNITSPIICFTSQGDNISPPQQTLGWILDLYRDVDDIRAHGQTIVYCVDEKAGHLALFVSSRVGAEEHEKFVQLMDVIDCLPPGLYEMVLTPRKGAEVGATLEPGRPGEEICHFETRTLDDIRAMGRNSLADDDAFAAAERLSQMNLSLYRTFLQPFVRTMASPATADLARRMDPLRLSYSLFSSSNNPFMRGLADLAQQVRANRAPLENGNPFLDWQEEISKQITTVLDSYRDIRDRFVEQWFFAFYGSQLIQGLLGLNSGTAPVRSLPGVTPRHIAFIEERKREFAAMLRQGGFDEALMRAVLYLTAANRKLGDHSAAALNAIEKKLPRLSLAELKTLARRQFFVLLLYPEDAIEALATLVPDPVRRKELLTTVFGVMTAGAPLTQAARQRFTRLAQALGAPAEANPAVH
jgi:hypothetical protein